MKYICALCKGKRLLCGNKECIFRLIYRVSKSVRSSIKPLLYAETMPFVFVGRKTMTPGVRKEIGHEIMSYRELINLSIEDAINYLASSVICRKERIDKEIIMSVKPVLCESEVERVKNVNIRTFSQVAVARRIKAVSNPRIPVKVERIVDDDLKASEQIRELYFKGYDCYYITNLLSAGLLGKEVARKIVPTRNAITAVDDCIFKELVKKVKESKIISDVELYFHEALGNRIVVLLLPEPWRFEMYELYDGFTLKEYEFHFGRDRYADVEGGAYYAARLAVAEHLFKRGVQARAIVYRRIYSKYVLPLGVWVVRETTRKALEGKCVKFSSKSEAFRFVENLLGRAVKTIEVSTLEKFLRR